MKIARDLDHKASHSRFRGFSTVSYLLGVTSAIAAPALWKDVVLPVASVADRSLPGIKLGEISSWSITASALLLAGAASVLLFRPRKRLGLYPWGEKHEDRPAAQQTCFPWVSSYTTGAPPLDTRWWLKDGTGKSAPWTDDDVRSLLQSELTEPFQGLDREPPVRAALHTAFVLHGRGDIRAERVFTQLTKASGDRASLVAAAEVIRLDPDFAEIMKRHMSGMASLHAWSTTALMSSLAWARKAGVVPNSWYIWLKEHDRSLFYALDAVGRASVSYPEGMAAACQYTEELLAGRALREYRLERAVQGARKSLEYLEASPT